MGYSNRNTPRRSTARAIEPTARNVLLITVVNTVFCHPDHSGRNSTPTNPSDLGRLALVLAQARENQHNPNYLRNLLVLTAVPTMILWVTKLFSSVPMTKRLVR